MTNEHQAKVQYISWLGYITRFVPVHPIYCMLGACHYATVSPHFPHS